MSSELYTYLFDKLFENGALDVFTSPIYMKKNRPAYMLSVICKIEDKEKIEDIILKETTTFGIRFYKVDRRILDRNFEKIETKYGEVTVKNGYLNGEKIKSTFEYECLKKIALDNNMPIQKLVSELYKNLS